MEHLSNEEKAKELIGCSPYSCKSSSVNFCQKTYHNGLMCREKKRLIKAMEWKEQQMIDKACDTIKNLLGGYVIRNFHSGDSYAMDKIIEDVKQSMRGEPEQ